MQIKILQEAGYEQALLGMSLSYYDHNTPLELWWTQEKFAKAEKRARILAHKGGGHNKFLESITVWLYVQACRGWWQEFDTYRVGVTKNSASTLHTLDKRFVIADDFEEGTSEVAIDAFNAALLNYKQGDKDITKLKNSLPEGWLQERQICTNYMTLQNIVRQRSKHRLTYWREFCEAMKWLQHPEFIFEDQNDK